MSLACVRLDHSVLVSSVPKTVSLWAKKLLTPVDVKHCLYYLTIKTLLKKPQTQSQTNLLWSDVVGSMFFCLWPACIPWVKFWPMGIMPWTSIRMRFKMLPLPATVHCLLRNFQLFFKEIQQCTACLSPSVRWTSSKFCSSVLFCPSKSSGTNIQG